jgi:putative MATE family efflux protein
MEPPTNPSVDQVKPTEGVKTLLGNPRVAIIKLSIPMIVAFSVQTLYNLVDAIWVSGLGPDALSAIGFFFPFFFMITSIAAGLGIGGSSALSRRIGARDKAGADHVATHSMIIICGVGLVFTVPCAIFAKALFQFMGAGRVTTLAAAYGSILFATGTLSFFNFAASAVLRGEGDVKRSMYAMLLGAILNIGLDPLFIYTLRLGVAGAAWATALSIAISGGFLFYWLFVERRSYVAISIRDFHFVKRIIRDIFGVGIPASVQQFSMALSIFVVNFVIVKVAGTDGVAIFTTGWRVNQFAILPLIGMATAVTAVCGAAYGGKAFDKLNIGFTYALSIGTIVETVIAVIVFGLAFPIAHLFTMAKDAARIMPGIVIFLRTMFIYYPSTASGIIASAMFQGCGKGVISLTITLIRTIVLIVPVAYFFAVVMKLGLPGVWWGFVVGNILGGIISFIWARIFIRNLRLLGSSGQAV